MRRHYAAYGLGISANVDVPGLRSTTLDGAPPDIRIELGPFPEDVAATLDTPHRPWIDGADLDGVLVSRLGEGRYVRFQYEWGVDCLLEPDAGRVWVTWNASRTIRDASLYLAGPVLGFLLRLRGRTCLHASAVAMNGRAIALAGCSGIGKSTLAWALARRGHPVLADDVTVLKESGARFEALPAHARLRVHPDAVAHFEGEHASRPHLADGWDKRYVDLLEGDLSVMSKPLPLAHVFLLEPSRVARAPQRERVTPTEAVPLLAANTYRNELLNAAMRAQEFDCLTRLVTTVPVSRLSYGVGLSNLDAVCELLTSHARRCSS